MVKNTIIMGRFELDKDDKKETMNISFKSSMYRLIDKRRCKQIAEDAVNKEYEKLLKKQGK